MIYLSLVVPEGTVITAPHIALMLKTADTDPTVKATFSSYVAKRCDAFRKLGLFQDDWELNHHATTQKGKVGDNNPLSFIIAMSLDGELIGTVVALDEGGVLAMGSRMPLPADAAIEFSNPTVVHFTNDEDSILFELSK